MLVHINRTTLHPAHIVAVYTAENALSAYEKTTILLSCGDRFHTDMKREDVNALWMDALKAWLPNGARQSTNGFETVTEIK